MPKLRKQRKKKKFRANVNRKRLKKKLTKRPKIRCKEIKEVWSERKSIRQNIEEMGLVFDPNDDIKESNVKMSLREKYLSADSTNADDFEDVSKKPPKVARKAHIVEELEADAYAPRVKKFRLPKGQVEWITYLMDKYGEDYHAMERDKRNHYQETWKQLRAKIARFMKVPEQYSEYLESKKLTST